MQYILKIITTVVISIVMQSSIVNMVSTTPEDAVTDFLDGLKSRESYVMEKYMDNGYVNFITNVQGDEEVVARMNEALFKNFSYEIEKIAQKDNVAVAKVIVKSGDFSDVLDQYDKASYDYVVDNLYSDGISDKEKLNAKCFEIYVQQIEKAAEDGAATETVVFVPMIDDGYYGWNIIMTDELMESVLGNLQMPVN